MTKLRCQSVRGIALAPQRPSAGVEAAYSKALTNLVEEMAASVEYWVRANYRKIERKWLRTPRPPRCFRAS